MQSIKDNEGRPWVITVTAATGHRIREAVQAEIETGEAGQAVPPTMAPFDVLNVATFAHTLTTLRTKFHVLGETLWAAVQPQAQARNVGREEFLESLSGDALEGMATAFIDELVAFFPAGHRQMLTLFREKLDEWSDSIAEAAAKQLETISVSDVAAVAAIPAADINTEVRS